MKLWILPTVIFFLGLLSVLIISSIAPALASRQLIFFCVGFGSFFSFAHIPFKRIQNLGVPGYFFTIGMLILTLLLGTITKGSTRWIDIGGLFSIQSSQLAIPATALYLGSLFEKKSFLKFKNVLFFLFLVAIPGGLILIEPDLGTTIVYLISVATVLLFSQTKKSHIFLLLLSGICCIILAWSFVLEPYQKNRITSFLNPSDIQGSSYNARQSLIAVGSGQILGRGLGQGIQSHLRFLPERQTDFVFASFAEEFGFIGSGIVLILYTILIATTLEIGRNATSKPEKIFCFATATMTIIQTGVNIGMNVGVVPITGITLPFLSYGGSSILTLLSMYGIVQSVKNGQKQKVTLHLQ